VIDHGGDLAVNETSKAEATTRVRQRAAARKAAGRRTGTPKRNCFPAQSTRLSAQTTLPEKTVLSSRGGDALTAVNLNGPPLPTKPKRPMISDSSLGAPAKKQKW